MVDELKRAFGAARIAGMTITEVKGYGRQFGHTELYSGTEYQVDFLPKIQVMVLLPASRLQDAQDIVRNLIEKREKQTDATPRIGEGIMYVKPVLGAIRLRNGEKLF